MAATENKRSSSRTQLTTTPKHRSSKRATAKPNHKKREKLPPSLRFTVTKRGKTTIRRYPGRHFHRFGEAQGKPLDYIEFFTAGEYHSMTFAFGIKPLCTSSLNPASRLNPSTLTGKPATTVASSDGRLSTASRTIPDICRRLNFTPHPSPLLRRMGFNGMPLFKALLQFFVRLMRGPWIHHLV